MMCEKAGEVTAKTRSKFLQLGAIFRTYSKVRRYLLYPSKQLYNPQHFVPIHTFFIQIVQYEFIQRAASTQREPRGAKPELTSCPDQAAPGCPDL
jgi:hypothetical protein